MLVTLPILGLPLVRSATALPKSVCDYTNQGPSSQGGERRGGVFENVGYPWQYRAQVIFMESIILKAITKKTPSGYVFHKCNYRVMLHTCTLIKWLVYKYDLEKEGRVYLTFSLAYYLFRGCDSPKKWHPKKNPCFLLLRDYLCHLPKTCTVFISGTPATYNVRVV